MKYSEYEANADSQLPLPVKEDLVLVKCLRAKPPRQWTHTTQSRDNRTVAVWCHCSECQELLRGPSQVYTRKPKGK